MILKDFEGKSQVVSHRLFKDQMQVTGGISKKDLKQLNRNLADVIVLDIDSMHIVPDCLDNVLFLKPFAGDFKLDNELFRWIPFLEHCQKADVSDVRDFIFSLKSGDIPMTYYTEIGKSLASSENKTLKISLRVLKNTNH